MTSCFRLGASRLTVALIAMTPLSAANLTKHSIPRQLKVRSVVRVDAGTGRLVRSVVVTPRAVTPGVTESPTPAEPARDAAVARASDATISDIVEEAAKRHSVDPLLVHSVIEVESGYNPYAVSPKGARGLMQLIPATARRFGVSNTFDVKQNVEGGVRYLKYLNSLFPDDLRLTLAAYNAGEGAVWKYRNSIPPYTETKQYVQKVGQKYGNARRAAEDNKPAAQAAAPTPNSVPSRIEHFVDAEGRLHLRTAAGSAQQRVLAP